MMPKRARRTEEISHISGTLFQFRNNRRMVSSVGWNSAGLLSGRSRVKPPPDQHSGSLDNCEESAAFVMTSANRRFRLIALLLIQFLWDVKEPTPLFEKSRGRRPRWCGQPFLSWVGYL